MAIKNFDKTKLKPVETLKQSRAKTTDAESSGEPVTDDDAIEAPLKSKLMHRRHTVNVALSTEDVSENSDLTSPRDPSISQSKDCFDDLLSKH